MLLLGLEREIEHTFKDFGRARAGSEPMPTPVGRYVHRRRGGAQPNGGEPAASPEEYQRARGGARWPRLPVRRGGSAVAAFSPAARRSRREQPNTDGARSGIAAVASLSCAGGSLLPMREIAAVVRCASS